MGNRLPDGLGGRDHLAKDVRSLLSKGQLQKGWVTRVELPKTLEPSFLYPRRGGVGFNRFCRSATTSALTQTAGDGRP
jgi:hypothetical protein